MDVIGDMREKVGTCCLLGSSKPETVAVIGYGVATNVFGAVRYFFKVQEPHFNFDPDFGFKLVAAEDCFFCQLDEPANEVVNG